MQCLGVWRSRQKCERARNGSGEAVALKRACSGCGEQRCKAHCRCGRSSSTGASGRKAPRAAALPASRPVPVLPVQQGPAATTEMLDIEEWHRRCHRDLLAAAKVDVASFIFDHAGVHQTLLQRLQGAVSGRKPLDLNVYVDAETLSDNVSRLQASRLKQLHKAGARVWLCTGTGRLGVYHVKGIVIDDRVLYTGSANITSKSLQNLEWCFRMVGPVVSEAVARLAGDRRSARHRLWAGR